MAQTTKTKRVSFYMLEDELEYVDRLKQVKFYDKSYADLYRHLLKVGIAKELERGKEA